MSYGETKALKDSTQRSTQYFRKLFLIWRSFMTSERRNTPKQIESSQSNQKEIFSSLPKDTTDLWAFYFPFIKFNSSLHNRKSISRRWSWSEGEQIKRRYLYRSELKRRKPAAFAACKLRLVKLRLIGSIFGGSTRATFSFPFTQPLHTRTETGM